MYSIYILCVTLHLVRCSSLQYFAVCCSVSQCVAGCCRVLQSVVGCCIVLQCASVCCSVFQYVTAFDSVLQCVAVRCSALRCVALWCSDSSSDPSSALPIYMNSSCHQSKHGSTMSKFPQTLCYNRRSKVVNVSCDRLLGSFDRT